jgi:hypothetical protein
MAQRFGVSESQVRQIERRSGNGAQPSIFIDRFDDKCIPFAVGAAG